MPCNGSASAGWPPSSAWPPAWPRRCSPWCSTRGPNPRPLLYANLDLKEAGQITQALDQSGVKYEVKGDGSTIMVPRDKVAATRIMLSTKGMPTSGSVGYEIFDTASPLGQTDFIQNLNRQRALEGELARTIRSLQGVNTARVHLVLPRRQLFENEGESPSASIVIGVGMHSLGADQVAAVRNLIAGAVPNLKPDRVTVVDERGKLLPAWATVKAPARPGTPPATTPKSACARPSRTWSRAWSARARRASRSPPTSSATA